MDSLKKTYVKFFVNRSVDELEKEVNLFIQQKEIEVIEITEAMNEEKVLVKVFYLTDCGVNA